MEHVTVGRVHNAGKTAHINCRRNPPLDNIDIKNKSFLLLVLTSGSIRFSVDKKEFTATAPAEYRKKAVEKRKSEINK